MALTPDDVYTVNVTFRDRDNNTSTITFYLNSALGLAGDADAAVSGFILPALAALTDAVILSYSISFGQTESAPAVAPETSDIERKGVFTFRAANGATMKQEIPSIKNTLVVDGSNVLDRANAAVATYIAYMLAGGPLNLANPRTYLGSDLVNVITTKKTHRGSSKG